ncbi:unnamed protein product [Strongylus vulgaris]|uniref:Uncharacterized protein n=1 Tax=Strongylus vulgaris TaxID=40348 RepID=A0A3P7JXG1_STRVU|nr:unnamed protein product [Strongylus vulgaris]
MKNIEGHVYARRLVIQHMRTQAASLEYNEGVGTTRDENEWRGPAGQRVAPNVDIVDARPWPRPSCFRRQARSTRARVCVSVGLVVEVSVFSSYMEN